jgi:cytochrome c oxidase cbb3-type subunit 1
VSTLQTRRSSAFASIGSVAAFTSIFAILALLIASHAADPLMGAHAWLFLGLAVVGLLALALWAGSLGDRDPFDQTVYEDTIVKFGVTASMFWGIAGFWSG